MSTESTVVTRSSTRTGPKRPHGPQRADAHTLLLPHGARRSRVALSVRPYRSLAQADDDDDRYCLARDATPVHICRIHNKPTRLDTKIRVDTPTNIALTDLDESD
jgi:hypothetical protein